MSWPTSFAQGSLAATYIASFVGTYAALSSPNPSLEPVPATGDAIRSLNLTSKHATKVTLAPLGLLTLHSSALACLYPQIPVYALRYGTDNGFNNRSVTWSSATAVPLALILCVGVPLRLFSYASLGKNFTFALAEPDQLKTTGIYKYVQHPSYTALIVVILCNVALFGRLDGVASCWIPPDWHRLLQESRWFLIPAGISIVICGVWIRVRQEEQMLKAKFKLKWERWHASTARFLPWVF